jgi:lipoprotein-anchoring transpeptidase ErfK/SrfK
MIVKERKPTTVWKSEANSNRQSAIGNRRSQDWILTRILWLEGLQPGVNQGGEVDSFSRYIYIHGTNHEELLGQPASHGCVRMSNLDVLLLFDAVETGSLVWIM